MNNGYQKSNGCNADKEGGKFFKTFFYPNAQSKHVRPLAYNVFGLGDRLRNEACAKPVLGGEANSCIY